MSLNAIVVDDFYENPDEVRKYALAQKLFEPYAVASDQSVVPQSAREWKSTEYRTLPNCPFKSSKGLVTRLEEIVGEQIDMDYWNADYPTHMIDWAPIYKKAAIATKRENLNAPSSWWNCMFHFKMRKNERGTFVHTHALEILNGTGAHGWAGIVYLTPNPPAESGLMMWRNRAGDQNIIADHQAPDPSRWELIDQYANVYNRLVIHRGNVPHSGGPGWDAPIDKARMFQTFFFKTKKMVGRDKLPIKL